MKTIKSGIESVKTPQQITAELKQFRGSDIIYKHWLGLRYTEGIKHLAEVAECWWLVDAIASYQTENLLCDSKLREFQIWRLLVQEKSGVLICEWDTEQEALRQQIPFTDFPLPEIKLYLIDKVLMLPSEY